MRTSNYIKTFAFFSIFLAVFTTGCYRESFAIFGSGAQIEQERNLAPFTGVELSCDAKVILHVDSVYRVEMRVQQNILNVLRTEIRGSVLKIDFSHNVRSYSQVTLDVYAPYYVYAAVSGSGKIQNTGSWNSGSFEANISGSGDISISGLQTSGVESTISGSGKITLSGTCTSLTSRISGSGDLFAFGLIGNTGDVRVSGSGKHELNLSQSIDVHISGSGDVYYKNNPTLDVSISGSGDLIHVL